jgi:hypothetical protein
MNYNNYFDSIDWRKQAAMTAVNDLDIEKAFSDQASGFVENKVGDLMKEQYRVGFEVVKKNEDNTRMVGVFAFKVGSSLIFAPVFFINGEIKGPLLYCCDKKKFLPATKEWGNYLVESMELSEGKGRSRSRRGDSPPRVNMHQIIFSPMQKHASCDAERCYTEALAYKLKPTTTPGKYIAVRSEGTANRLPLNNAGTNSLGIKRGDGDGTIRINLDDDTDIMTVAQADAVKKASAFYWNVGDKEVWFDANQATDIHDFINADIVQPAWSDTMIDAIAKEAAANENIIRDFLMEQDYGSPAADAIIKAASANREFAARLAEGHGTPDNIFPSAYTFTAPEEKPELSVTFDAGMLKGASEDVKKEFFAQGFYIKDTRPTSMVAEVSRYDDMLSAPSMPGMYSILREDGQFEDDVLVLQNASYMDQHSHYGDKTLSPAELADEEALEKCEHGSKWLTKKADMLLVKGGKVLRTQNAFGIYTGTYDNYAGFKNRLEAGKLYLIVSKVSGVVRGTLAPITVKSASGVQYVTAAKGNIMPGDNDIRLGVYKDDADQVVVNPDLKQSDFGANVYGKDVCFLEINHDTENFGGSTSDNKMYKADTLEGIGGIRTMDSFLMNSFNLPRIKVEKVDVMGKSAAYVISGMEQKSRPMSKLHTMVKLAQDMTIASSDVSAIMRDVEANGKSEFVWSPMEKIALRLRLVDQPNFQDEFDSEFGIPVRPDQTFRLAVHGDQTFERPPAIGDAMNPTTPTGLPDNTVAAANPADLQDLADLYKLPHVFDHAVVGTLADTFNAMPLVRKYIPRLEDGVDALGRIKFLLHWCPNDFERSYGEDDMVNLESEVDSNFVSSGSLLLKLKKKNDLLREEDDSHPAGTDKDNV